MAQEVRILLGGPEPKSDCLVCILAPFPLYVPAGTHPGRQPGWPSAQKTQVEFQLSASAWASLLLLQAWESELIKNQSIHKSVLICYIS